MEGLYRRRKVWWIRFTPAPGADQVRLSTGETDEAKAIPEARRLKDEETARVREQLFTCAAEIDAYLLAEKRKGLARETLKDRRYVLEGFVKVVSAATPRTIGTLAIQKWFDTRAEKQIHTALAYLHVVGYWFKWLVEEGKLLRSPVDQVKTPDKVPMQFRKVFLLPAESRKFIAGCVVKDSDFPKHLNGVKAQRQARMQKLRFINYCGLHAGLRKLEVIEATPQWFDLHAKLLHVQPTATYEPKDRECRTIPLTDEFCKFLKGYMKELPADAPFMLAPEVKHGKYRYRYDFRKLFEEHATRMGMPHITFHDLRRTFASQLVSAGVSLYKVGKWLGDEHRTVEKTYGHLIPQDPEINVLGSQLGKILQMPRPVQAA